VNKRANTVSTDADNLAANHGWEIDREVMLAQNVRRAHWAGVSGVAVGVLGVAAVAMHGPLTHIVPIPIVVDRATGEATVQSVLSEATVPVVDALDKHFATLFVRARESYDWEWLARDYETVARLSSPEVFKVYAGQFEGADKLTDRLGSRTQWRVRIVSVRLPPQARTANQGEAIVTFDRETRSVAQNVSTEAPVRYVAAVRFEYRPKLLEREADRLENPLGFLVTAYRADPEASAPPAEGRTP